MYATADNTLDYTAHKGVSHIDEGPGLSESLFVNANDSIMQDFDVGEIDITDTNPDQYFQDDAYIQDNISVEEGNGPIDEEDNQQEGENQEYDYVDEQVNEEDESFNFNEKFGDEECYEAEEGVDENVDMVDEGEEMFDTAEENFDEGEDQYKDMENVDDEDYGEQDVENSDEVDVQEPADEEEEEEHYEEDTTGGVMEEIDENEEDDLQDTGDGVEKGDVDEKDDNGIDLGEDQDLAIDNVDNQENLEENQLVVEGLKDEQQNNEQECDMNEEKDSLAKDGLPLKEKTDSVDESGDMEKVDGESRTGDLLDSKGENESKAGEKEASLKGKLGLDEVAESKVEKSEVSGTRCVLKVFIMGLFLLQSILVSLVSFGISKVACFTPKHNAVHILWCHCK